MSQATFKARLTAPGTPPSGYVYFYVKSDSLLYFKDDTGTEYPVKPIGGGTGDLLSDGSVPLVDDWDVGEFKILADQLESTIVSGDVLLEDNTELLLEDDTELRLEQGAPPFIVASAAVVANLNASFLEGLGAAAFATAAQGALADTALQPGEAIQPDGSVPLVANWDVGSFKIIAEQFESDVTTGTPPLVVASQTEVANLNVELHQGMGVLDEDDLASNSNTDVPTQQSVKTYVDGLVTGLFSLEGEYDASVNSPNLDSSPSGVLESQAWVVTVSGAFFLEVVQPGDIVIAKQDDPTTRDHWIVLEGNHENPGWYSTALGFPVIQGDRVIYQGSSVNAAELTDTFSFNSIPGDVWLHNNGTANLNITPASGDKLIVNGVDLGVDVVYALEPSKLAYVIPAVANSTWVVTVFGTGSGGGLTPVFIDDTDSPYDASAGEVVFCDSTNGAITVNYPASPDDKDKVNVWDHGGAAQTNNITIGRNGNTINGDAEDFVINQNYGKVNAAWNDTDSDWAAALSGNPSGDGWTEEEIDARIAEVTGGVVHIAFENVADDALATYDFGESVLGSVLITTNDVDEWANLTIRTAATHFCGIMSQGSGLEFAATTGVLAAAGGTDGKMNVSVDQTTNTLYISNRRGGIRSFYLLIAVS